MPELRLLSFDESGLMQLTTKQKHSIAMWISDILGSMIGGVIITIWLSMVIYYGIGLDKVICNG
jgi:hypothetical protein